jgi:hypothetical protein
METLAVHLPGLYLKEALALMGITIELANPPADPDWPHYRMAFGSIGVDGS